MAELDPRAFGLQTQVTLGVVALVERAGGGSVHAENNLLSLAANIIRIPFASLLHPLFGEDRVQVEALERAVHRIVSEKVAATGAADLRLVPDASISARADEHAAVIALCAFMLRQPPLR